MQIPRVQHQTGYVVQCVCVYGLKVVTDSNSSCCHWLQTNSRARALTTLTESLTAAETFSMPLCGHLLLGNKYEAIHISKSISSVNDKIKFINK